MRKEGEDDDGDDKEWELWGEKRRHQTEAGTDIHLPESRELSHNTTDEDAEDPQPAKRQKLPSAPTFKAATPPYGHSLTPRVTPSSTMQPEMDEATPTSRSPSAPVESVPIAEYQEWPFQGFLKHTKIGNETTCNLKFKLLYVLEHLNLLINPEALDISTNSETSAMAGIPYEAVSHSKVHLTALRPRIKCLRWTSEEDATVLKMREDNCSWEEIHNALPHRSIGTIQVHYSTKLKG